MSDMYILLILGTGIILLASGTALVRSLLGKKKQERSHSHIVLR